METKMNIQVCEIHWEEGVKLTTQMKGKQCNFIINLEPGCAIFTLLLLSLLEATV